MDLDIVVKLGGLAIAFLSGLFMTGTQRWKSKTAQGELLDRFESALVNGSPYAVSHLFYLLHGLRLACEDIKLLVGRDDSILIIEILKKNRRLTLSGGEFSFEVPARVRRMARNLSRAYMVFLCSCIVIIVSLTLSIQNGFQSFVLTLTLFFLTVALVVQYRDHLSAESAELLVTNEQADDIPA